MSEEAPRMYDVSLDKFRAVTQEDVAQMEAILAAQSIYRCALRGLEASMHSVVVKEMTIDEFRAAASPLIELDRSDLTLANTAG